MYLSRKAMHRLYATSLHLLMIPDLNARESLAGKVFCRCVEG